METFPSGEEEKKLKKANTRHLASKIGIVLALLLLLFFSWQILGTFSQPGPGGGITQSSTAMTCSGTLDGDHWTKSQSGQAWSACQNNTDEHWKYNYPYYIDGHSVGNGSDTYPKLVNTNYDANGRNNTVSLLPKKGVTWQVRRIINDRPCASETTCYAPPRDWNCAGEGQQGSQGYLYAPHAAWYDPSSQELNILEGGVCIGSNKPGNQRKLYVDANGNWKKEIGQHGRWVVGIPPIFDNTGFNQPSSFYGNLIADTGNARIMECSNCLSDQRCDCNPTVNFFTVRHGGSGEPATVNVLPGTTRRITGGFCGRYLVAGGTDSAVYIYQPTNCNNPQAGPVYPEETISQLQNAPTGGGGGLLCTVQSVEWGESFINDTLNPGLDKNKYILITDAYSREIQTKQPGGPGNNRVILAHQLSTNNWEVVWEWNVPNLFDWTFAGKIQYFNDDPQNHPHGYYRILVGSVNMHAFIVSQPFEDITKPSSKNPFSNYDPLLSALDLGLYSIDVNFITAQKTTDYYPLLSVDYHPAGAGDKNLLGNRVVEVNKTFRHDRMKEGYTDNYGNDQDIYGKFILDNDQGPADPYRLVALGTKDNARGQMISFPLNLKKSDPSYVSVIKKLTVDADTPRNQNGDTLMHFEIAGASGSETPIWANPKDNASYSHAYVWFGGSQSTRSQRAWTVDKTTNETALKLNAYFWSRGRPNDSFIGGSSYRAITPFLHGWKIEWENKTASFSPTLTATTGKEPDPRAYTTDGAAQFYTGKEHNIVRYKFTATNNGDWPANNLRLQITPDNKESLTGQAYYRIIKKNRPATAQKLKVYAAYYDSSGQCKPNPNACHPLPMRVRVKNPAGVTVYEGSANVNQPYSGGFKDYEFDAYPTTEDRVEVEFPNDIGDLIVQKITVNKTDYLGTVDVYTVEEGCNCDKVRAGQNCIKVKYYHLPDGKELYFCQPLGKYDLDFLFNNQAVIMPWKGYIVFPSTPHYDPVAINNNTISLGEVLDPGDKVEIIYTTKINQAGKINHKATLNFKNRGNNVWALPVSASCTGNAPWVQTLYGDVYLGGCQPPAQCFPYQAYGNATFLIQSDGTIHPYFSSQKGWLQPNYPIKGGPLERENVLAKIKTEVEKLKPKMKLLESKPEWEWCRTNLKLTATDIANEDVGIWVSGGCVNLTGGEFRNDKGAKLLVVENGLLAISGDSFYGNQPVNDIKQLGSLGIVVLNGAVHVGWNVKQIIGAYFVNGTFCTCNYWYFGCASNDSYCIGSHCNQPLKAFGLWVAKNFVLPRSYTDTSTPPAPAEQIIYDGRVALNPPPGFSEFGKILPVWKEVAP